jgi:urea transport system permease protein
MIGGGVNFTSAGRTHWGWILAIFILLLLLPAVLDTNTPTLLGIWALFALSLGLMWGYAGILSFGHAAYFGLGAYTYAITSMNLGESTVAWIMAIVLPAFVAALVGAMMFYGRISDVYMGVITLVFSLIMAKFMGATAGDAYVIGNARLGGFNGIPAFPILNVPGDPSTPIYGTALYYLVLCCLLLCYLVSRWVLSSAFGRVLLGIRENEARIELLGYNAPAYKTAIFSLSAAMAGMAGCLFASWAEIVTPALFGLGQSVEVIIWVIAGGMGTLMGPIIGAVLLGSMKLLLGGQTLIDNSLVIGAILVLVVLLLPKGLLPTLMGWRKQHGQSSVNRAHTNSLRRRGGERSPRPKANEQDKTGR